MYLRRKKMSLLQKIKTIRKHTTSGNKKIPQRFRPSVLKGENDEFAPLPKQLENCAPSPHSVENGKHSLNCTLCPTTKKKNIRKLLPAPF